MKIYMPQEIQVWYILPALRREFAKCFVSEFKMNQKETAKLMGVTEPAISQYFKSKRAAEIVFDDYVIRRIKRACRRVVSGKTKITEEIYKLSVSDTVIHATCKVHRKHDSNVEKGCKMCFLKNDRIKI